MPTEIECPSCGANNPSTAKFCGNCRAQITAHDPVLKSDLTPGRKTWLSIQRIFYNPDSSPFNPQQKRIIWVITSIFFAALALPYGILTFLFGGENTTLHGSLILMVSGIIQLYATRSFFKRKMRVGYLCIVAGFILFYVGTFSSI